MQKLDLEIKEENGKATEPISMINQKPYAIIVDDK